MQQHDQSPVQIRASQPKVTVLASPPNRTLFSAFPSTMQAYPTAMAAVHVEMAASLRLGMVPLDSNPIPMQECSALAAAQLVLAAALALAAARLVQAAVPRAPTTYATPTSDRLSTPVNSWSIHMDVCGLTQAPLELHSVWPSGRPAQSEDRRHPTQRSMTRSQRGWAAETQPAPPAQLSVED